MKRKWRVLFFIDCLLFSAIFIIRRLSILKFLINADRELLIHWYPHMGSLFFYFLKSLSITQTALGLIAIGFFLWFLALDIRINPKKYKDLASRRVMRAIGTYFLIIVISLLIAEIVFRKVFGIVPGIGQTHFDFRKVDTLKVYRGYITDRDGIFKFDYTAAKDIEKSLKREGGNPYALAEAGNFYGQLLGVYQQAALLYNPEIKFEFALYCKSLANKPILSDFDSAVIEYSRHPINSEGFRSIAFRNYTARRKKVLLLGDSFTFGQAPEYLFQSFADILLAKDLAVFNTGITSMDPPQYLAIAKKFIPVLHPDYVVVNLCLENDAFYYTRKLQPFIPFFYATNAGDLYTAPWGRSLWTSAQDAYNNILEEVSIPVQKSVFYPFYTKTAVGTVLWQFFDKLSLVTESPRPLQPAYHQMSYPSCNDDLKEIKVIADSNNCKLIIIAIPAYSDTGLTNVSNYPNLMTGMQYYTAPVIQQDYETRTRHYNASGHKKHGDFILKLIGE